MRNSKLSVGGLFGISGAVEIVFPERGLIAIQGENGAGKSSILDSLSVAMFGEPTPARSVKNADILSRSASEGFVTLEFPWKGSSYRINREFKRLMKKDGVNHKAFLYRIAPDGTEEGIATGPDAVNEAVASIISGGSVRKEGSELVKIVKSAWLSSVFLPQGEITRLLKMKPAERREIISALFGLEEGGVLKERSKELFALADEEMKGLLADERAVSSSLQEHPVQSVKDAEERLDKLSGVVLDIERNLGVWTERHRRLSELSDVLSASERSQEALEKAAGALARVEYEFRLSEAKNEQNGLRSCAERVCRILSEVASLKKKVAAAETALREQEEKAESIRETREKLTSELALVKSDADKAPLVRTIRELRSALGGINGKIAPKTRSHEELVKKQTILEYVLARDRVSSLRKGVEEASLKLESVSGELRSLGESIRGRLVDWIELLSSGSGVISVDDVKKMDPVQFSLTLEKAGFSSALSLMGKRSGEEESARSVLNSRKEALAEAEKQYELVSAAGVPGEDEVLPFAGRSVEELSRSVEEGRKAEGGLLAEIAALSSTAAELKEQGKGIKANLGGADEDRCLQASERAAALDRSIRELSASLEKASASHNAAGVELAGLRGKIETANWSLSEVRERTKEISLRWKQAVLGFTREDFRAMNAMQSATAAETVEEKRRECLSLERAVKDLARREADIRAEGRYPGDLAGIGVELKAAQARVTELDRERMASVAAKAGLQKDLESFRMLTGKLRRVREGMKSILPAYEKAKVVSKLLEGNAFGNFLQDRALTILLEYVNGGLAASERYSGYSFSSSGGSIFVEDEDKMKRDVASLSGGEATMATILLLRGMQSVSGIGGMIAVDEGFAQLDTKNLEDALEVLSSLSADSLVIAITHDPDFAREFDTVWKVEKGGIITVSGKAANQQEIGTGFGDPA